MFVFRPALCFFADGNATAHARQGRLGHCRRLASRAHRRGSMCGIAGFLGGGAGRDLGRVALAMADALRHRGPDDAGIWADAEAGVALGHRRLAVLEAPFSLAGQEVHAAASLGIALFPEDGADPDELLKNADLALYRAKGEGRGRVRFFEPAMDEEVRARRRLEVELRRAMERGEFL